MNVIKPITEESRKVQSAISPTQMRRNRLGRKIWRLKEKLQTTNNVFLRMVLAYRITGLEKRIMKIK